MRKSVESTALDMNTPGFDFLSGAGLIQAQAALATFAAPDPVITDLVVPANTTPGTTTFTLTVKGNYFTNQTKVLFRGSAITTTYVSNTQLTATYPSLPVIRLYRPSHNQYLLTVMMVELQTHFISFQKSKRKLL